MIESFDYIVIGSGLAGLAFALESAKHGRTAVITKRSLFDSNTNHAQGGIASVTSKVDTFERHIADTMNAGAGLCDEKIVRITVEEGPAAVDWLMKMGVEFTRREGTDELDLGREGGHTARRVLHAGDITGRAIQKSLVDRIAEQPNIVVFERHTAVDLIMKHKITGDPADRVCLGVYVYDAAANEVKTFTAPVTVIATGGAGKVYLYTSNPDVATGDGIAMAYRAGARAANMEFIQFHPTCLYHPQAKSFLISEALRGEGGELLTMDGEPFMKSRHAMGSLAPRDIVARAIDTELKTSGRDYVLLDMTHLPGDFLRSRFPSIYAECLQYGIDMAVRPIPVVPAAHYCCGGVLVDEFGRTTRGGLYAVGEASCTGLHGANRLASNSLLEAVVFARRAVLHARDHFSGKMAAGFFDRVPVWDKGRAVPSHEKVVISQIWDEIRRFMWNYVGISRTTARLKRARSRIDLVRGEIDAYYWKYTLDDDLVEVRNIALIADLIITSAGLRKESRGLHYLLDHPGHDDRYFGRPTVV